MRHAYSSSFRGTKRAHASFDARAANETLYVRDEASDGEAVVAYIWRISPLDLLKALRDSGAPAA